MRSTPRRRPTSGTAGPLVDFGASITERRLALRLTQLDLADLADVGLSSVRNLEAGRTSPTLTTSLRILDALGLTLVSMPLADTRSLPPRAVALHTTEDGSI
ncbi:helix-turn-helix domain-containing protein [Nocardia sp. NPDC055321]